MTIATCLTKPSLFLILLALCTPTFAITVQTPSCEIEGDPDIYGIGIRSGFYLQWAALIIILFFNPKDGDAHRTASAITTFAVYINTFRSMRQGSLIAIDYPLLWYLTSSLTIFNWPTSEVGFKKHGGSQAMVLVIWAMYYLAGPWVFFKGLQIGRQPGCDIKYFVFAPISIYAKGLSNWFKFTSVLGIITSFILLCVAAGLVWLWFASWGEDLGDEESEDNRILAMVFGVMQLSLGAFTIAFAEMNLKHNHITFPDTHITDSGQLIPFLIGIFTFVVAFVSALRAMAKKSSSRTE